MTWVDGYANLFSFLGFILSVVSIIVSCIIYNKVKAIRDDAQTPYRMGTKENLNNIHDSFKDVMRVIKDYDGNYTGEYDEETTYEERRSEMPLDITEQLSEFYRINKKTMIILLETTKKELDLWVDLDNNSREKYKKIVSSYEWLTYNFFQNKVDEEVVVRIWTDNYKKMLNKKFEIEEILDNML